MILDKNIQIKVSSSYFKKLLDLGYKDIKFGDIITIPILHLSKGSGEIVNVKCDVCGTEKKLKYGTYQKNFSHGNIYCCSMKCVRKNKMDNKKITINSYDDFSYIIGLFQTDGHLSDNERNRGKLQLELNVKDCDIIYKIKNILDSMNVNSSISERDRRTNFGHSKTISLTGSSMF